MHDLIVVKDLVKYYPIRRGVIPATVGYVRAVDGVSFSIPQGKTLGLVGESGCGKTTVGRTILRLIEPTAGQVLFDGREIFSLGSNEMRRLRREMQIIFQDPFGSLNPRQTVGAVLREPLLVHGVLPSTAAQSAQSGENRAGTTASPSRRRMAGERAA